MENKINRTTIYSNIVTILFVLIVLLYQATGSKYAYWIGWLALVVGLILGVNIILKLKSYPKFK